MPGIALELVLLMALIVANGLLAMSEIAIVSVRKARLRHSADEGDPRAAAALELANHPNRFLSTVQVGITLVGILAGALGGARIAGGISALLESAGVAQAYGDAIAFGAVVVGITFLNVVLGELVPKRIALANAEAISARVAGPMTLFARIGAPVVSLLTGATDFVLRLAGRTTKPEPGIREEELIAILGHAAEKGVIEAREQQIIERLFRLSDHTVAEIMTPRARVVYLDLEEEFDVALQRIRANEHPRYPVCRAGLDNTIGFVTVHELFLARLDAVPPLDVGMVRDPHWVEPEFPALRLLHVFQASGVHMAIVRDAARRVQGIVTV
ncbi:MAG: hemolysin family protein, partial [Gemmatimonadota bacterium]